MLENIADIALLAKLAQVLSFIDFTKKYKWAINNTNLNKSKEPRLTSIK